MADEKKAVKTSEESKKEKVPFGKKFVGFFKKIGKGIAHFFKDLRGETKKIVWPGRQMVLKSTGIVLAAILVIGAGIWIIDFAISGAVTGLNSAANKVEATTQAPAEEEHDHDHDEDDSEDKTEEKPEESTTEA